MKINLETRNIFTKRGRLNRRIDRHAKLLKKIEEIDELLAKLNNKECIKEEVEECIIRCDDCGNEFDIANKDIDRYEKIEKDEDDEIYTTTQYVCPKCGFSNEIDLDDEDELEEGENNSTNDEESIDDIIEEIDDIIEENEEVLDRDKSLKKVKVVDVSNKNHKLHSFTNKSRSIKFIHDENIINAINIAKEHKSLSETLSMLKEKGIELISAKDKNTIQYSNKNGSIALVSDETNKDSVGMFIINTKLILVPHGNCIKLYNGILSQLGIEKADESFESIKLAGKACIIKLNDGSLAACNFNIVNNELTMSIIYDIEDDE